MYKLRTLCCKGVTRYNRCLDNEGWAMNRLYDTLIPTSADPIRIATWNIQELWWYSYRGNKLGKIKNYLREKELDLICLQEVFERKTLNSILEDVIIRMRYPYYLTGSLKNAYYLGENSGLLVLSKYPIAFGGFYPFKESRVPDSLAYKGALYFRVGQINFITTHLQSEAPLIARPQLANIIDEMPFSANTILLGDLNMTDPGLVGDNYPCEHTHTSFRRLDYIIPVHRNMEIDVDVDYMNISGCSDHYPVVGCIRASS